MNEPPMTVMPEPVEGTIVFIVGWVKLGIEIFGASLVTLGVCVAIVHLIRTLVAGDSSDFTSTRLILARYLALALEFELGADILGTAVSPDWDHIGKLAAVAVIRTGLNYFLSMEMKAEIAVQKEKVALVPQSDEENPSTATPKHTESLAQNTREP